MIKSIPTYKKYIWQQTIPGKGIQIYPDLFAARAFSYKKRCQLSIHMNNQYDTDFFLVGTCSANTSKQYLALNSRMKRGSLNGSLSKNHKIQCHDIIDQSSLAIPRSLQHLINALLLHASVAVAIPEGSKYSCSPRATATSLVSFSVAIKKKYLANQPSKTDKRILSTNNLGADISLTSGSQPPSTWTECFIQNSTIFDLRKINETIY